MKRMILALVVTLAGVGCSIGGDTRRVIEEGIAVNANHMQRETLPREAREVATDNHDLLWSILYREGVVDELPEDVRARKAERAAAGGGQ